MLLPDHEWQQCHVARALDGVRELALVPGADAGALAGHDLAEGRQVTLERFRVLVVNGGHVLPAEPAGTVRCFCFGGHNGGSRVRRSGLVMANE